MPAAENSPAREDKSLGMDRPISRRDFLNSTLLASGGLLMSSVTPRQLLGEGDDWTGYAGNTDLAGIMDHRCSILEAERAVAVTRPGLD